MIQWYLFSLPSLTRFAAGGSQKMFHSAVPSEPSTSSVNTLPGTSIAPPVRQRRRRRRQEQVAAATTTNTTLGVRSKGVRKKSAEKDETSTKPKSCRKHTNKPEKQAVVVVSITAAIYRPSVGLNTERRNPLATHAKKKGRGGGGRALFRAAVADVRHEKEHASACGHAKAQQNSRSLM